MYRSVDGGRTWRAVNAGLGAALARDRLAHRLIEGFVYSLTVEPGNPQTVYAGSLFGLFKTTDGGGRWRPVGPGLPRGPGGVGVGSTVAIDPSHPGTVFAAGGLRGGGIFRSSDGGRSWRAIGLLNESVGSLAVDPNDSGTVYAGTEHGAFTSRDGGATWQPAGLSGRRVGPFVLDPRAPGTVYAATAEGVEKSTDAGASWRLVTPARTEWTWVSSLALAPGDPHRVYASTAAAGVLASDDAGASWHVANAGLTASRIGALAVDPHGAHAVYAGTWLQGIYRSGDGGASWTPTTGVLRRTVAPGRHTVPPSVTALAVDAGRQRTVYAGTGEAGVFRSSDGGRSWRAAGPLREGRAIVALLVRPGGAVYAGTMHRGLFKSVDGGSTWSRVALGRRVVGLAGDPARAATVYTATSHGLFRSGDAGRTWTRTLEKHVWAVATGVQDPGVVYAGTSGGVYESADGGEHWSASSAGLTKHDVRVLAVDPSRPGVVYAAGAGGAFASTDAGASWKLLMSRAVTALAVAADGRRVYAGTPGGGVVVLDAPTR